MEKKKQIQNLKFYSLDRILSTQSDYNMIFGMRSNGKTFAVQRYALEEYFKHGSQIAIVRRYEYDFIGKRGQEMFTHLVRNEILGNLVEQLSNGEWTDIYYWSNRWYMCKYDEKGQRIKDPVPFAYAFSLGAGEHDKSTSYPNIRTILFDEFLTRDAYLPDEFIKFTNVISTIVRYRDDVKIFMCGNTVNKYSPYFKEMGLDRVQKMNAGDLHVYKFAALKNRELKIAVEYSDNPNKKGKPSDIYFAFNNPKLKMITNGVWELAIYPHLPMKYKSTDIIFIYFIQFEEATLQCEIIQLEDLTFTFIHAKTTPLKDTQNDLIFSPEFNPRPNYRRRITNPHDDIGKKVLWYFNTDKVFYQDNEIGEVVRNYMNWSRSSVNFV